MALVANPAPVEQQYHRKSTPSPTGLIQDEFYEETRDLLTACVECGFGKGETDVRISEERRYIVKLVIQTVKADETYFRKLCEDLELTAANLFTKLMDVWNGMFTDGRISNGRLVALLSFCQYVTVYCRSVGLPSIESSVPHWAAFFIATQLKDWIVGRGGWDALSKDISTASSKSRTGSNGWFQWGMSGLALAITVLDAALHNS